MGGLCSCCGKKAAVEPVRKSTPTPIPPTRSPTPRFLTPAPSYRQPRIETPISQYEHLPEPLFTDIGVSTSNPLRLIEGYKNEPLVSLEEALRPFYGKIDQLADSIREAKLKCHYPSEHNLTHDESAALYIYAMKWGDDCLYDTLHAAWKTENPTEMKPWLKYLKLFKSAYDKLPDAKGEIWQGTTFDQELNEQLTTKSLNIYSTMGSCSSSKQLVEQYLEERGDTRKILIGFNAIGGKVLGLHATGTSDDIIIWPGTKLGLADLEVIDQTDSVIFHLIGKRSKYHFSLTFST